MSTILIGYPLEIDSPISMPLSSTILKISKTVSKALTKFSGLLHWLPAWKLIPSTDNPSLTVSSIKSAASSGSIPNLFENLTTEPSSEIFILNNNH